MKRYVTVQIQYNTDHEASSSATVGLSEGKEQAEKLAMDRALYHNKQGNTNIEVYVAKLISRAEVPVPAVNIVPLDTDEAAKVPYRDPKKF